MSVTDNVSVKSLMSVVAVIVMLSIGSPDTLGDQSYFQQPTVGMLKYLRSNFIQTLGFISETAVKDLWFEKAHTFIYKLPDIDYSITKNIDQSSQHHTHQSASHAIPITTTASDSTQRYENSSLGIQLQYPIGWYKIAADDSVRIFFKKQSTLPSGLAIPVNLTIDVSNTNVPLDQLVAMDVNSHRQNLVDFNLIYSIGNTFTNNPMYKVVFSYKYGKDFLKVMQIWMGVNDRVYSITYSSELDRYSDYLAAIQKMIASLNFAGAKIQTTHFVNRTGLRIGTYPYDITVNPVTNIIYMTNLYSNTVSVIDGSTDRLLTNINVGNLPVALAVNPTTDRLYVANQGSNTVSVIDTSTNKVLTDINVGSKPTELALDPFGGSLNNLIFVANSGSDTVSVIDGSNNTKLNDIRVGHEPVGLSINPITKRLYVANSGSNTVSVIDYFTSQTGGFKSSILAKIHVGNFPISLGFNPSNDRLYVANSVSDTVTVINGSNNEKLIDIPVGSFPTSLYINANTNMIYVPNFGSDTVSVIDGSNNTKLKKDIPVGGSPLAISFNPFTNILYVTNEYSHTLSEIQNSTQLAGVLFNIKPSNAGYLICNQSKIQENVYVRYVIGVTLDCTAKPNSQFAFSSWSGDMGPSSSSSTNNTEIIFKVSRYGNLTSNFVNSVAITFQKQFWEGLTSNLLPFIILPIVGAIATWFIPSIIGYINGRKRRLCLRRCMLEIIEIQNKYRTEKEYLKALEEKRNEIASLLTEGKITDSQYDILNNKISAFRDESISSNSSEHE